MDIKIDKNKYGLYLFMAIILIIGGVFFLNKYLVTLRIDDPDSLAALLKKNNLQEQAKKKFTPPKINVDFFNNNERFNDLEEIKINIKDVEELKIGTKNPFELNEAEQSGKDLDNIIKNLKTENN